jgi:formylglycine-generating enzyme required for sulfatase activity
MIKLRFFLGAALIGALLVVGCDDPEGPGTEDPAVPEGFVLVEGGTFTMGSPEDEENRYSDEVQHSVTVGSFYLGKYEVTQKEWEALMETGLEAQRDLAQAAYGADDWPLYGDGDNYPMYYVSWLEAVKYCNARSEDEGLTQAYTIAGGEGAETVTCDWDADGYRLPTEAEWEYAAKGGKAGSSFLYSGSDTAGDVAWYDDNSESAAHAVGGKAVNGLGVYDMSGNLWEWCWDWYGAYGEAAQNNPQGPGSGSLRVLRGGAWRNSAGNLRSSQRSGGPSGRFEWLGFRLARSR